MYSLSNAQWLTLHGRISFEEISSFNTGQELQGIEVLVPSFMCIGKLGLH